MLKKLHEKSHVWFAVLWIAAYCVLMSLGDVLSGLVGVEKSVTLLVGLMLSVTLIFFLKRWGLFEKYGLCKAKTKAKSMLFYIPVLITLTANFWCGVKLKYGILETVLYILAMFSVGFLEEVIFRGLLFVALRKNGEGLAVTVSSLTFGMGHIINLLNGSGAEFIPNLLQLIYATAAGFMFVMIFLRSKSLLVCILTHGLFNALSAFSNDMGAGIEMQILTAALLTVITGSYAVYLAFFAFGREE